MGQKRYTEAGHRVYDVANWLGISNKSLYDWIKACGPMSEALQAAKAEQEELKKLKAELKRVTQERDILKEAAR